LSDDPGATKKISSFATSQDRWMVAVRMVSEGVDVPRLAVGVYATSVSTPLFFAQAVGRFVRARRRGETASVFLPSVPVLLGFAAELEAERDHVVAHAQRDAEEELAEAQRTRNTPDMALEGRSFEALKASATFDRVLFDGGEFGTATEAGSPEEEDYLGLPGLLEPDQVTALLRKRQASQLSTRAQAQASSSSPAYSAAPSGAYSAAPSLAATSAALPAATANSAPWASAAASPASPVAGVPTAVPAAKPAVSRESLATLRKELNGLVGAWSHRTGQPHGVIHSELRNACGGPAIPQASAEQIQARIEKIRQWALSRR
jgi:hypothetical protein